MPPLLVVSENLNVTIAAMRRLLSVALFALVPMLSFAVAAQQTAKHPMSLDDLARLQRVSNPVISSDGKWIAYSVAKAGTKVPMLLFIHGGPTSQDAHAFNVERQLFAGHGFAVLNVNYRGSTGRGLAYSRDINVDWGDKEVIDLLAAVDAAVATGNIDPDKLVVGGWSYGGILTDYMIASTTRFKATSSGAGTGNLFVMYGVDEYVLQYDDELGQPWKNPALWMKLSYPFFHVERIKTPTLYMGGTLDFNVPLVGGEQMYQALRDIGTPAELI